MTEGVIPISMEHINPDPHYQMYREHLAEIFGLLSEEIANVGIIEISSERINDVVEKLQLPTGVSVCDHGSKPIVAIDPIQRMQKITELFGDESEMLKKVSIYGLAHEIGHALLVNILSKNETQEIPRDFAAPWFIEGAVEVFALLVTSILCACEDNSKKPEDILNEIRSSQQSISFRFDEDILCNWYDGGYNKIHTLNGNKYPWLKEGFCICTNMLLTVLPEEFKLEEYLQDPVGFLNYLVQSS